MGSPLDWLKAVLDLRARQIFALVIAGIGVLGFASVFGPRLGVPLPENVRVFCLYGTVALFFWGVAVAVFSGGESMSRKRAQGRHRATSRKEAQEKLRNLPPEVLVLVALCAKGHRQAFWSRHDEPATSYLAQKFWFEPGELAGRRVGFDHVYLFTFDDMEWQVILEQRDELLKVLRETESQDGGREYLTDLQQQLVRWSQSNSDF